MGFRRVVIPFVHDHPALDDEQQLRQLALESVRSLGYDVPDDVPMSVQRPTFTDDEGFVVDGFPQVVVG